MSDEPIPPANHRQVKSFFLEANPGKWDDWKGLSKVEQEPYKQMSKQDLVRYQKEAKEYKAAKYFGNHPEELVVQPLTKPELDLPCSVDLRKLRLMKKEDLTDGYIDGVSGKTVKAINSTRGITTLGKVKDELKNYVAGKECK